MVYRSVNGHLLEYEARKHLITFWLDACLKNNSWWPLLFQLENAVDQAAFDKAFSGCEWRYDVDGLPHKVPFQEKKVFIKEVATFFTIIKCKSMLDALLEGLRYYEVIYMHVDI